MNGLGGESLPDASACESALLKELVTGMQARKEEKEWRRGSPRGDSDSVHMLELRRHNGTTRQVRVQNVSSNGVCVISRSAIDLDEVVQLRLPMEDAEYEFFRVAHVTSTLGGFKVGMSLVGEPENRPD